MTSSAKEAANAFFKKASTNQADAPPAAQYETDACVVREKTMRLKQLRLAEQAAELEVLVPFANKTVRSL